MLTKKFFAVLLLVTCAAPIFAMTTTGTQDKPKSADAVLIDDAKNLFAKVDLKIKALNAAQRDLDGLLQDTLREDASADEKKNYNEALQKARETLKKAQKEVQEVLNASNATIIPVDTVVKTAGDNPIAYYLTFPARWVNAKFARLGSSNPKVAALITTAAVLGVTYAIFHEPINDAIAGDNDSAEVRF